VKISGTSVLHATPDKVWAAITDPAVLAGVIPGCQVLNPLGDNHFGLTVHMGVAAIKGTYAGEVKLYDLVAPSSLTMRAAGAGAPGTIDTTVAVTLSDAGDGTTRLDYDADAAVGGMVGGVGQRVLTSVAKKTAGLFFASIDDVLTGKRAVTEQSAAGAPSLAPGAAASGESPFGATLAAPAAAGPAGVGPAALVAAAVAGAVAMAVGVLIGARIARRR
jgi:carbon monoxide dehydrogenase subunit G